MGEDLSQTRVLLGRWHGGERGALEHLLERDLEWIRRKVRRELGEKLRRVGDTGDFVQEALIAALEESPRFLMSSRGEFRALLAKIVINVLRGEHRRMHALMRTPEREKPLLSDTVLYLDGPRDSSGTRPDEAAARAEEKAWIQLAIQVVAPDDRTVIELHWRGLTDGAIGERLGLTANTARMRRTRAIGRLADCVLKLKNGRVSDLVADPKESEA